MKKNKSNTLGYTIDNAIKRNSETNGEYEIVSYKQIEKLKVGDYVKLRFDETNYFERMWVCITNIGNGRFKGYLSNQPFNLQSIKYGDVVKFNRSMIIDCDSKKNMIAREKEMSFEEMFASMMLVHGNANKTDNKCFRDKFETDEAYELFMNVISQFK